MSERPKGERTCSECKFAIMRDYGYSNYTVEGTEFQCGKNVHPDGAFDRFYGENKRLYYAQWCNSFMAGTPIELDVDGENLANLEEWERELVEAADNKWNY